MITESLPGPLEHHEQIQTEQDKTLSEPKQNRRELIKELPRVAFGGGLSLVTLSLVIKSGATSDLPECINHAMCTECGILPTCERTEAVAKRDNDQEATHGVSS